MRRALPRLCGGIRLTVTAALMLGARRSAAQYPLAPSPVIDSRRLGRDPQFSGYVSVRQTIRGDSSTFVVNRARVTLQVIPTELVVLRIGTDLAALGRAIRDTVPGFVLTDAYVQLSPPNSWRVPGGITPTLILGQFRTPFSLEYLTPFSLLHTADRSQVVNRLATKRDIGVMAHLAFAGRATLAGGYVNGEGPNSIRNANGKQLAAGRLTLFPVTTLAVGGKWAGEGADHRWGYDARWMTRALVVEGERIERRAALTGSTTQRSAGHYLLASYKVHRHVQPVVKWEQLRDVQSEAGGATSRTRLTWTTYGLNLLSSRENVRFQSNWIVKEEHPTDASNELVLQLIVIF